MTKNVIVNSYESVPDFGEFCDVVSRSQSIPIERLRREARIRSDLGIAGADVGELLNDISSSFGTDFSLFPYAEVAGAEAGFNPFIYISRMIFQRSRNSREIDISIWQLYCAVRDGAWKGK